MDEKTREIIQLIFKYHRSTLEASEREVLEAWLTKDERNRELLQDYGRFSRLVRDMRFYEETDVEKGYDAVFRKISGLQRQDMRKRRYVWAAVAASLIVLVTFSALWQREGTEKEQPMISLATPDRSGVRLELSDGKMIILANTLVVKENDGASVAVNDTTGIVYQAMPGEVVAEEELVYNTMITPRGTEYLLTLSDGSRVWLNSDSRLKFPVKFSKGSRRVELVGEGYFEVVKDTSSPFVVSSGGLEVTVTGTAFNISAYPEEKAMQTTLVSGSVDVSCPGDPKVAKVSLTPNEIAVFAAGDHKIETKKTDIMPYVAWHEGYLCFHDENLGSIATKLERWYDITFEFDAPETRELVFYGSIKRHGSIMQVLDMLRYTNLIDFTIIDSKTVRVTRL